MSRNIMILEGSRMVIRALIFNNGFTDSPRMKSFCLFLTPKLVVKATFIGKPRSNARSSSIMITYGVPNHRERKYLGKKQVSPYGTWGPAVLFKNSR